MSTEKPHPITLQTVLFVRSTVVAIQAHVPDEGMVSASPENNIVINKVEGQPGHYNASMRTVINPEMEPNSPYLIDMECIAIFVADDTLSEEEALRGVTITAHNVLYGAIRESVLWLTSRQPFGPLMLGLSVLKSAPAAAATAP
jgi:preprotein translocase subunit SecB